MDKNAISLIKRQLENMPLVELKGVARNLKEKKSFKFSTLKKAELIETILEYIDFKPMFTSVYPKQDKFKFKIPKSEDDLFFRLNELMCIVCQKRLQKLDYEREKCEYIRLRIELEKYN